MSSGLQHLHCQGTFRQLPQRLADVLCVVHPQPSCCFKLQLLPLPQGGHTCTQPWQGCPAPLHKQRQAWVPVLTVSSSPTSPCGPSVLRGSHGMRRCRFGVSVEEERSGSPCVTVVGPPLVSSS